VNRLCNLDLRRSRVDVYAPGNTKSFRRLQNSAPADYLKFATTAGTGYLFVPDSLGTSVSFFKHDARRASFVLQTVQDVHDVAINPAGVP